MAAIRPRERLSLPRQLGSQALLYARLMRLDRPIGIWLLLWPTLWGLWIAAEGFPPPQLFLIFAAGVVVMRSAGCVINDLADRDLDRGVRRTRDRPLATGQVSVAEALTLFAALGLLGLALLVPLNTLARQLAAVAVVLTVVYPLGKRFISAPQLVLGAAFGWGIPMAFAATTGTVPRLAWLLWLVVVVWAVVYDTLYAMADREDDLRIGIRSTAVLFGQADLFILAVLMVLLCLGLVLVGREAGLGSWYYAFVAAGAVRLALQRVRIRRREPEACLDAFRDHHLFGALIFCGILLDYGFRAGG